ncbi:MAG: hypothetical protein LIO59_00975 [Oscillospiraceae bacterium]|nr:hypothetical protein [Oscillospiraceae bacterium]
MKVYQMIYTSVRHSLSDSALGLANQSGLRVYSCTQGITRDNINELIRFSGYKLPKNNKTAYSEVMGDPSVPDLFPKTFRALRLSDGRYAVVQSVFSGVDFQSQPGNFFAHAFVFDEVPDDFVPELYYGSKEFKTYLTTNEAENELVHYLPELDDIKPEEGFEQKILDFIEEHKKEMSYLVSKALVLLTSETVKNICVATDSEEKTALYLIALKYLLPRDISENVGISTYNVYLPSEKQHNIVFHGTIKGKNNITDQAIQTRESCLYMDMEKTDIIKNEPLTLFQFPIKTLREKYNKYKFNSVTSLLDWFATHEEISKPGMGGKLLSLKKSGGDRIFAMRASEIYPLVSKEEMSGVRFEITKVMYDNISLFPDEVESVTDAYMGQCIDKLCVGQSYDIENMLSKGENSKIQAKLLKEKIPAYMYKIKNSMETLGEKNKLVLLSFFAEVKHETEIKTWKEFFGTKENISIFVEMAAPSVITGIGVRVFTAPSGWNNSDLSELVAYFDSSTQDENIKRSCLKYIYRNEDEDWESYGITLVKHTKTRGEQERDMENIHKMLAKVGYIPYQRNTYRDLKREVTNDMNDSNSPLLLSRLLDSVYKWQNKYGNQSATEKAAEKVRSLLLEMKKTERSCYNFIIPKLALEIIESQGHYHEIIINTETMPASFWNWFLIGYNRCKRDDALIAYTRVYSASKKKISKLPIRQKMRETFQNVE